MRILELRLKASDLESMRRYYAEVLGLPVIEEQDSVIGFQAGETRLVFERQPDMHGIYHFAFNIPENQMQAACDWLAARTAIRLHEGRAFDFADWKAHAVYFYDPAGNILELIARHSLPNASDVPFAPSSLLCISEVGVVTEDVPSCVERLCRALDVRLYRGSGSDVFAAVGDEYGLFITVKRGRPWMPENIPAEACPTSMTIAGASPGQMRLADALCAIQVQAGLAGSPC